LSTYSVSQKKSPAVQFSDIFCQTVENFKSIFSRLLYVPTYAGLQIFIQLSLSQTLM